MKQQIETDTLVLIAGNQDLLEHALAGDQALQEYLRVRVPEHWTQFGGRAFPYSLSQITRDPAAVGWWTYFPVHKADATLIGVCGYKGRPTAQGTVEIGYEIAPEYRGRGLATAVAAALVTHAFTHPAVHAVQAHTLGETNASTRVLEKCGFSKIEEAEDTEHGALWKWQVTRAR